MNILTKIPIYLLLVLSALTFTSCQHDDPEPDTPTESELTVFMYMPWAGSDIYSYFINNIKGFEESITNNGGLDSRRLLVFISQNGSNSCLFEIKYNKGMCECDTLGQYDFSSVDYTTAQGLTNVINNVKNEAPAKAYSMIIGCHGMGWLPVNDKTAQRVMISRSAFKNRPQTRYFGHSSDSKYQTDISTLSESIANTGIKMKYIAFDDCYMSNVETAYELRNAADYLIASTSEVMIDGFPYRKIGKYLLHNDLQSVCDGFYDYYSAYDPPCGTIGITDCSQVEAMAQIMREINNEYPKGLEDASTVQKLDGYDSKYYGGATIFFDFGDYVDKLCTDETLKAKFNAQLEKLVPYKAHTSTYYSMFLSGDGQRSINAFSGLTISDPSENTFFGVKTSKKETSWHKATH